jgi:hypothetical protein
MCFDIIVYEGLNQEIKDKTLGRTKNVIQCKIKQLMAVGRDRHQGLSTTLSQKERIRQ